jgi:hypothetical protein
VLTPVEIAKALTPDELTRLSLIVAERWRQPFGILKVRRLKTSTDVEIELEKEVRHNVTLSKGTSMETEEARALANVLLEHHRHLCQNLHLTPVSVAPQHMLPYGELCAKANLGYLTRTVGHFLGQVAEWCHENGLPPLNSLAVNEQTRMPGEGYDGAAGCSLAHWWNEVQACITCSTYPHRI